MGQGVVLLRWREETFFRCSVARLIVPVNRHMPCKIITDGYHHICLGKAPSAPYHDSEVTSAQEVVDRGKSPLEKKRRIEVEERTH